MSTLLKPRFSGRRGPIGSVLLTVLLIGAGLVVAAPSPASAAVPSAPTRVSVLASDASVRVAWFSPDDDGGQDITSYQITASTGTVFSVLDAPVTLSGFSNGVPVSFRVAAINSDGIGPASPPSAAVTPTAKTLTNTWSAGSLMTTGRQNPSAVRLENGRVLAIAGRPQRRRRRRRVDQHRALQPHHQEVVAHWFAQAGALLLQQHAARRWFGC